MKNQKSQINKILEYWYMMEFLNQENFPSERKYIKKIRNHKKRCKKGEVSNAKYLMEFMNIGDGEIIPTVSEEAKECRMKCWGNITIYVGKIKRETCIKELITKFGIKEDDRPETSVDSIALAAFQVSPQGTYIDQSLSLSPVLWAVSKVEGQQDNTSNGMSYGAYNNEIMELEKFFIPKNDEEEPYLVRLDDIHRLYECIYYKYIENVFSKNSFQIEVEKSYVMLYQMFCDEKSKTQYEDDMYIGLSRGYFLNDIKMLINQNALATLDKKMQDYILALYENYIEKDDFSKIDVVHSNNLEQYELYLNRMFCLENAPLGKWPSKYMPAFMQQMAVNLLVGENTQKIFRRDGDIFSVNGPPGTGKTTLLKEIVVNNVVERAVLLAKYDFPDDAFEKYEFCNENNQIHSKYVPCWYKLKNDKINDYGILITSSNNAAVENISKELPIGDSILRDLNTEGEKSEIIKEQLEEVQQLFDVTKSEDKEKLFKWNKEDTREFPDIYFTEYANELLGIQNAWGLIAAPLGKKSNNSRFYYNVLSNLSKDLYDTNATVEDRVNKYRKVRQMFWKQYKIVKGMQNELNLYTVFSIETIEKIYKLEKQIQENQRLLTHKNSEKEEEKRNLERIEKSFESCYEKFKDIEFRRETAEKQYKRQETEQKSLEVQLHEIGIKILSVKDSIGFFAKLFKTRKFREVMEQIELYRKESDKIQGKIFDNQTRNALGKENLDLLNEQYQSLKREINDINSDRKSVQQNLLEIENQENELKKDIREEKINIENCQKKYTQIMNGFAGGKEDQKGIVINKEYIQKLFSSEEKESTQAQVDNPWTTQKYNREREKLFYYAMKLNKEFILSSKACRNNFRSLGHYWGYLKEGQKIIEFSEKDKKVCITALIQTLFLLVPVISSTFASVGSFLKDVNQSGALGLLVIDEAGQAQPQMALGALFRTRKAMIVGDPKQIEPVVTDDLKILREAYKEEVYAPYKEKDVSVQICADIMNPFGTFIDNGSDNPEWVGCPLLVHRRCVSPMYDISNILSYNGMMKQQTAKPKPEIEQTFIYSKSQWIDIGGKEKGNKDHFVREQGVEVCNMLEKAFQKSSFPNVFIISPFTTVVNGMKAYLSKNGAKYIKNVSSSDLNKWMNKSIGTVHTFQGKEANEVIFLLGCDYSRAASGAVRWVNKNIVNVAVTRAKYRLYVIGDKRAWENSDCVSEMRKIMEKHEKSEGRPMTEEDIRQLKDKLGVDDDWDLEVPEEELFGEELTDEIIKEILGR